MYDYCLKFRKSERELLIRFLSELGLIKESEGIVYLADKSSWDEIGTVVEDPNDKFETPIGGFDDPYYFVNYRSENHLMKLIDDRIAKDETFFVKEMDLVLPLLGMNAEGEIIPSDLQVRVWL